MGGVETGRGAAILRGHPNYGSLWASSLHACTEAVRHAVTETAGFGGVGLSPSHGTSPSLTLRLRSTHAKAWRAATGTSGRE